MKKYRKFKVTSEHPFLKEGLEFVENDYIPGVSAESISFRVSNLFEEHPTWFEEIDSRWKPEISFSYNYINSYGEIDVTYWRNDETDLGRYNLGNVFKSEKEAEQARDKVKALLLNLN